MFNKLFKHKHRWQTRGVNRWGLTTYRFCLKCKETQQRVNKSHEKELFSPCKPIVYLDKQFDEDNNFII